MAGEQLPSEQFEDLELDHEPEPLEDPMTWRLDDPDRAERANPSHPGEPVTGPEEGQPWDSLRTEGGEAGPGERAAGAEHRAMRVEDGWSEEAQPEDAEDGEGRTGEWPQP